MKKPDLTKTRVIVPLALVATILWGSAYPCIKLGYEWFGMAAEDIPAKLLFAGIRFILAGLLTLAFGAVSGRRVPAPQKENIPGIIALGLVLTMLHYIFFYIGLANTTGAKGAIVYGTSTFFAVLLAAACYKSDRLNPRKGAGCLLGFAGIVYVNLGSGGLEGGFSFAGEGCMLTAAVLFAAGNLMSKRLSQREASVTITGWQLTVGGAVLAAAGVIFGGGFEMVTGRGIGLLFYLSLLSAVAFTVWTLLLQANSMGRVTIFNFLVPIFGVILSGMILGEDILTLRNVISLACVSIGIYLVNSRRAHEEG